MNKNSLKLFCKFMGIVILVLAIISCGSKVNQTNFNKIQTNMTQEEVTSILGSPTESSSVGMGAFSGSASKWISKEGTITIQFVNGKVIAKQFIKTQS